MARKKIVSPATTSQETPVTLSNRSDRFIAYVPLIFVGLYLCIHFIPDFAAFDAMGPQWMYVVGLDLLVILYILSRKNEYNLAAEVVFKNIFSRLYLAFFVLAGFSIFTAINPTESWVCYVRMIATIIAFFNMSILLNGRLDLFSWLAQLLGFILLYESLITLVQFLRGVETIKLTELIMSLKGTTGNKNIFAADLIVKIPFVIYCILNSKIWGRILNIGILLLAAITIFIVNSRASYVSLLFILLIYLFYTLHTHFRERKLETTLYRMAYVLIPLIVALIIAQVELGNVSSLQPEKEVNYYGTVTERLGTITAINSDDSKVRFRLWAHALDYASQHPFLGCGVGNWKLASIPYQKGITNDLIVPVHAHNDYVEMFAELGIVGGLLYLSLFITIFIFTLTVFFSKADETIRTVSLFSFLAFVGYSIDAFFNFPIERPISQVFFALLTAINLNAFLAYKKGLVTDEKPTRDNSGSYKAVFGLVAMLLLMPAAYITYQTYQSLIIQRIIIPDLDNEPMKLNYKEIFPRIPSIPNLSASAQPLEAIKGRYLYEAGNYKEALVLLNRAINANPFIAYSQFLKAGVFFRQNKMDSSYKNATEAFYTRPRAKTYYQTLIAVLAKMKDTASIQRAFDTVITYRNEPYVWNLYILGMLNANTQRKERLLKITDSALAQFPDNADLILRRKETLYFIGTNNPASQRDASADVAKAQTYYDAGVAAFGRAQVAANNKNEVLKKEEYTRAANNFLKAGEITPGNYIIFENTAISYFNMGEFSKSIPYFNKVIALKTSTDGKSEYFLGVALYNLGRKAEGCAVLQKALAKGYAAADTILKNNCK